MPKVPLVQSPDETTSAGCLQVQDSYIYQCDQCHAALVASNFSPLALLSFCEVIWELSVIQPEMEQTL